MLQVVGNEVSHQKHGGRGMAQFAARIQQKTRSPGTSYENEDCFKSWIASLVSASYNIELNTMRTSSWAEKAGIYSVKSKRHCHWTLSGHTSDIYNWYETLLETKLTESTITSLIYFSIRTDLDYARCLNPLASGLPRT